jgi:hypothetical protein
MRKEAVNMKKTPIWEKTIFAQFENSGLKNELMKWASKHRLNVVWGNPTHPDLIAYPSFALVIDRNLIIENQIYSQYLSHIDEGNSDGELKELRDTSICIIIDNIKDLALPSLDMVLQVDLNQKNAVQWILHNLELASKLVAGTSAKHLKAAEKAIDKYLKKQK